MATPTPETLGAFMDRMMSTTKGSSQPLAKVHADHLQVWVGDEHVGWIRSIDMKIDPGRDYVIFTTDRDDDFGGVIECREFRLSPRKQNYILSKSSLISSQDVLDLLPGDLPSYTIIRQEHRVATDDYIIRTDWRVLKIAIEDYDLIFDLKDFVPVDTGPNDPDTSPAFSISGPLIVDGSIAATSTERKIVDELKTFNPTAWDAMLELAKRRIIPETPSASIIRGKTSDRMWIDEFDAIKEVIRRDEAFKAVSFETRRVRDVTEGKDYRLDILGGKKVFIPDA